MARGKYTTVKIPSELAETLDSSCGYLGYRSRAEMVADAVRMFIVSVRRFEEGEAPRESAPLLTAKSR